MIKPCGCYDGRWGPDDDRTVSVRCNEHAETPPEDPDALKMTVREAEIAASVAIPRALKKGLLAPKSHATRHAC